MAGEVARYVADKPEGPFEFQDVVLRGTGKDTWDRLAPHNPTIHKVGNKYVLFYIANNGTDGFPANQQIGMVMAESRFADLPLGADDLAAVHIPECFCQSPAEVK